MDPGREDKEVYSNIAFKYILNTNFVNSLFRVFISSTNLFMLGLQGKIHYNMYVT